MWRCVGGSSDRAFPIPFTLHVRPERRSDADVDYTAVSVSMVALRSGGRTVSASAKLLTQPIVSLERNVERELLAARLYDEFGKPLEAWFMAT